MDTSGHSNLRTQFRSAKEKRSSLFVEIVIEIGIETYLEKHKWLNLLSMLGKARNLIGSEETNSNCISDFW